MDYLGLLWVQYYVESRKVVAKEAKVAKEAGVAMPAKTVAADNPPAIQAA